MTGSYFNEINYFDKYKNRKFTKKEIIKSIENFVGSVNPDLNPSRKELEYVKSISLPTFIFNKYGKKNKSLFIFYFENTSETLRTFTVPKKDKNPMLTNKMIKSYEKGLGGVKFKEYTVSQMNKFITASEMLISFYKKTSKRFIVPLSIYDLAEMMYQALTDYFSDGKIEIGHFCSDFTFTKVLPAYLNKQAVIK
jgi:hypothetical protein